MTNAGGFSVGRIGGKIGLGGLGGRSGDSGNSSTFDEPFSNLSRLFLFLGTNWVCLAASCSSLAFLSASSCAFFATTASCRCLAAAAQPDHS